MKPAHEERAAPKGRPVILRKACPANPAAQRAFFVSFAAISNISSGA